MWVAFCKVVKWKGSEVTQKCKWSRKTVKLHKSASEVMLKKHVQHRFHRSAAFAPQSTVVPAERAVLEAELPKLRKVFVSKTRTCERKLISSFQNENIHNFRASSKSCTPRSGSCKRRSRSCTWWQSHQSCTCFLCFWFMSPLVGEVDSALVAEDGEVC